MLELLWFVLASYGLTQIIVYGTIFDSIRPPCESYGGLGKVFHCTMCMGFWVGLFLWGVNSFTELITFEQTIITALMCGSVASGTSYALSSLFGDNGFQIGVSKE